MRCVIITKPSVRTHTTAAITVMDHRVLHASALLHKHLCVLSVRAGECSSESGAQPVE